MVFRILKANQVKEIDTPFIIDNGQKPEEKPKEPDIDPNEDAFAAEAFRILSPDELASGGQIKTKKPVSPAEGKDIKEESAQQEIAAQDTPLKAVANNEDNSFLSQAARKSRHAAVLEQIKIKELELEALEDELREWEARLQQQEQELLKKEREVTQANIKKRQDVEAECQQTMKMAKEAAESLKAAAKTEAETIKKQAKIEVDSVREKAYKEGFEMGEEKGIAQGEEEGQREIEIDWKNLMQESEMIANELQASRIGILKASEEEMLRLVISFAKTVIKTEPMANPEIIIQNINQAINNIADVDKVVIKINLRDKAMCEAHKEKILSRLGNVSELRIVEDPSLSAGGVKIETGVGTIDATLETQCKALERALLDSFEKSRLG